MITLCYCRVVPYDVVYQQLSYLFGSSSNPLKRNTTSLPLLFVRYSLHSRAISVALQSLLQNDLRRSSTFAICCKAGSRNCTRRTNLKLCSNFPTLQLWAISFDKKDFPMPGSPSINANCIGCLPMIHCSLTWDTWQILIAIIETTWLNCFSKLQSYFFFICTLGLMIK